MHVMWTYYASHVFLQFKVFYYPSTSVEDKSPKIILVDGNQTGTLISGLTPGTSYTIQVEAKTSDERLLHIGQLQITTKGTLLIGPIEF